MTMLIASYSMHIYAMRCGCRSTAFVEALRSAVTDVIDVPLVSTTAVHAAFVWCNNTANEQKLV
jgi:hypothetical protein